MVATRQPVHLAAKKVKNVVRDELQGTVGKVYVPSQDIDKMALRKMKGSKRKAGKTNDSTTATDGGEKNV